MDINPFHTTDLFLSPVKQKTTGFPMLQGGINYQKTMFRGGIERDH